MAQTIPRHFRVVNQSTQRFLYVKPRGARDQRACSGAETRSTASSAGNRQLQDRQLSQEEARQTTSARAVARLLMTELRADYARLEYMISNHIYDASAYRDRSFVSQVGLEDRKLLAGHLTEEHWVDVSEASQQVEVVAGELEAHRGRGSLGLEEREILQKAQSACGTAYTALAPLAEGKSSS
jgi:hypothetical protein